MKSSSHAPALLLFAALLCSGLPGWAAHGANLRIENVTFYAPRETGDMRAAFDVSWEASWRNDRNHDAAWIFLKLRRDGSAHHIRLAPTGHRVVRGPQSARIEMSSDGTGFFLSDTAPHRGPVSFRVEVVFHPDAVERAWGSGSIEPHGVEMVYVAPGPFFVGDPDPAAAEWGAFHRAGPDGAHEGVLAIESEAPVGIGPGGLGYPAEEYRGDGEGPIPAAFPKGTEAFYLMKYELTQGQYADFLNALDEGETFLRTGFYGRGYYENRGTIVLNNGSFVTGDPDRPMNFLTWDDGLAWTDWAGLRPITELEFTKAARGPERPNAGQFPWGTANKHRLARRVEADGRLGTGGGWTESQLTDETRDVFGASYYWVMDLAGSVWERVITLGTPDGRSFQGSHGDGQLGDGATATNEDWPHTYANRSGHGYRGGGFYDTGRAEHEFNPHSPVAYRPFGSWSGSSPHRAYGYRAGRSAGA